VVNTVLGLCDELITRPEESYRLWRVAVCYLESSIMKRTWPGLGRNARGKKILIDHVHGTIRLLRHISKYQSTEAHFRRYEHLPTSL
jgi:hypothetical protein